MKETVLSQPDALLCSISCLFLVLMKEPVLQDKQQEHVKFCKYANELLERVLGKKSSANLDASLEDIRRVSSLTLSFSSSPYLYSYHAYCAMLLHWILS